MEAMSHAQILSKEKLEFLDIFKQALAIPHQHFKFIIFTLFTSIPYFCLSVLFELVLHETFLATFNFLKQTSNYLYYDLEGDEDSPITSFRDNSNISKVNIYSQWIKLCFLYLGPFHLVGLFSIVMTVNAASMIYAGEKPMISLRDMARYRRLKGPFITSIYVLLLSTCILLGLVAVISNYYILTKGFAVVNYHFYDPYSYYVDSSITIFHFAVFISITIFHVAVFIALLVKYSEWSAGWNMALVISVLEAEEKFGFEAFELSAYYSRGGSRRRGLFFMLVFVIWEIVFRLNCLFGVFSERINGGILFISVCTCFICIGNLMKWVVCVVYFFDCKRRILEKKVDAEVGIDIKAVHV